ncbi:hypothetical protein [Streptomyces sp. NBC_00872]|uniref:hypothetical protein n=1 Tax=Streptomyces sp. NBC_00872 TaxID=2903686 RepID=UPI00386E07F6|nr:hypothetical protein OG214_12600 [Streptomyces sp. NBC_00872]
MDEETAEQQADITRLLLHHIHAPFTGTLYIQGVLPVPPPAEAVRVVTGPGPDHTPDRLTAYEFPLRPDDDPVTAGDITGMLRALHTGTRLYSGDSVSTVMGMTLVRVNPAAVDKTAATSDDNALTILRGVACPFTEEQPDPRLRGFLFLQQDLLRLYLDTEDIPGVIAADVRPSGAITALLAALPSLITEEERMTAAGDDPHCSRLVDLTTW